MHKANKLRAARAREALDAFDAGPIEPDEIGITIQHLITNLLHLATKEGLDCDYLLRRALEHFDYENASEYAGD
jgi:hypothetical protein